MTRRSSIIHFASLLALAMFTLSVGASGALACDTCGCKGKAEASADPAAEAGGCAGAKDCACKGDKECCKGDKDKKACGADCKCDKCKAKADGTCTKAKKDKACGPDCTCAKCVAKKADTAK